MTLQGSRHEKFGSIASFFYQRLAEPRLEPLHRRVASELPAEEGRLLDVGCGPGRLDRLLAAAHPRLRIIGLDASPEMIRQARAGPAFSNLEFREGTIETVALPEEFDFCLSVLSFHHWDTPTAGLDAIHRRLKPGGMLWIYEPDPDCPAEAFRADYACLWGWLLLPTGLQRYVFQGHGFSAADADRVVAPLVRASLFGGLEIRRTGSTLRLQMQK